MHLNLADMRRYLRGEVSETDAQSIESHLETCADCDRTIEDASRDKDFDPLIRCLRIDPADAADVRTRRRPFADMARFPFEDEASLERMLDRVRDFLRDGSVATFDGDSAKKFDAAAGGEAPYPAELGEYRILEPLGAGGMGTVLLAVHRRLERQVALKLIRIDRRRDPGAVARFEREIRAVGRLEHPNVVRAFDAGESNGLLYLAMEFVDGLPLSTVSSRLGSLSVADACEIVRQAASGIAAAHRADLVHRDVKPANVMLSVSSREDGIDAIAKVLDLGLARMQEEAASNGGELTNDGQVMGTLDFMAPEQAESSRDVGPPADVFGLGATLYRLLSGRSPLDVDASAGMLRKLSAIAAGEVVPLESCRPGLPPDLYDLVRRMLARNPAARPTASDVAAALRPFAEGADLGAVLASARTRPGHPDVGETSTVDTRAEASEVEVPGLPVAGPTFVAGPTTSSARFGSRRRTGAIVAIGVAAILPLVILGVILFVQTPRGTIRVEIEDPNITLKVKGTRLEFEGTGEESVSLEAGEHVLVVQEGERSFETRSFALRKNEIVAVRAELVEGAVSVSADGTEIARHERTDQPRTAEGGQERPTASPPLAISPFSARDAKQHQAEWAEHLGVPVEYENSIGMKFRLIPPGEYLRGSDRAETEGRFTEAEQGELFKICVDSERPRHRVVISRPFYLGTFEVTQGDFQSLYESSESGATAGADESGDADDSKLPADIVKWNEAIAFCRLLSRVEDLEPLDPADLAASLRDGFAGYRLPTEAEWEYACRAGTTTRYWIGDSETDLDVAAWTFEKSGHRLHPVGLLKANPYGLYDTHGNAWEWVLDAWDAEAYSAYASTPAVDPVVLPTDETVHRVARGSSYGIQRLDTRSAMRWMAHENFDAGIRLWLSVDGVRVKLSER